MPGVCCHDTCLVDVGRGYWDGGVIWEMMCLLVVGINSVCAYYLCIYISQAHTWI